MIKLQTAVVILSILAIESAWAASDATILDLITKSSGSGGCSSVHNARMATCEKIAEEKTKQNAQNSAALVEIQTQKIKCIEDSAKKLDSCEQKTQAGGCQEAEKEYSKSLKEFSNACSAAQIPMSRTTGHMACSAELYKCYNMDSDSAANEPTRPQLPGMRDLEREGARMDQCALLATSDQEKIEKQVDKARERKRDLDKTIPEIQDKMADAQDQADSKAQELAEKQQEAAKEYAQQMKESKRNMEAIQKQLGQQLVALQEQLDALDQQVNQLEMSMTDAEAKYQENITAIELACHAAASQEVAKLQEERLEKIKTNSFNRGGFSDMLKKVGVSDRDAWQREAAKRYQWCMESKPTRDQKRSALRGKELAIQAAQKAVAATEKRKVAIRQQMSQIKDQNGCGSATQNPDGTTNETEMCKAMRNAFEDQQQTAQEFQMKQQMMLQQQQQQALTAQRKQSMYAQQLQKASLEINDEQTRLRNLEEFLALKQQKAGGSTSATATEAAKARDAYSGFFSAAGTYGFACCRSDIQKKGGRCKEAESFMIKNGGDWQAFVTSAEVDAGDSDAIRPESEEPSPGRRDQPPPITPAGPPAPSTGER